MSKKNITTFSRVLKFYIDCHNKILFIILTLFISIIKYKKVYIFNTLTEFFHVGNFCYSYYKVKLYNPNFNDPTFRYCNGGAYGNFYSDYLSKLKKNFHYIDIGANIGIYSLIASNNNKCVKIDAFEPNPKVFNQLEINLSHLTYAKLSNVAISNNFGEINFYIDSKSSGSSQIDNLNPNLKIKAINRDSLRKIINSNEIVNIKIDVEGHELVVLEEIINTINFSKINSIYVEIANDKEILDKYVKKLEKFNLIYYNSTKKRLDCLFENKIKL